MAISSEMNASGGIVRHSGRRGMAFLVEALVVLAFLMLSLAVFVQLFSSAQLEGMRANRLSEAVLVATNRAEEFSADPTGVPTRVDEGDFTVRCDVTPRSYRAGTLYEATITVSVGNEDVYTLDTARYVSGGGAQ